MRAGDKAWLVMGCGILAYEVTAKPDELLSEAADRWMQRRPWLVRGIAFMLAAHVCNILPSRYDPLHILFKAKQLIR